MNKIAIIGLGYVGLPLAHAFSKKYDVVGFDISESRVEDLKKGVDKTLELDSSQLMEAIENGIIFTTKKEEIKKCTIFIVTVPTPIDKNKNPDLRPIIKATELIGEVLKNDDLIIYESTVYPGATEEICVPILEKKSGFKFNKNFYCGYSPERINPGDKLHTVTKIKKVTSGSTVESAEIIDKLYNSIIEAGTFKASSIKVAEAAKVIENTQRDINIAFINELSMIFNKMNIDTNEVLSAAGTKWNFLPFKPGLVGGHCIGVDPYYLTYKSEEIGYHPQIILSGRKVNDNMGNYVANQVIKLMIKKGHKIKNARVLILGLTFKENCPDIRNTKVIDIYRELVEFGCEVSVYDPWAKDKEVKNEYGIDLLKSLDELDSFNSIILAVAHNEFNTIKWENNKKTVLYDVKGILPTTITDGRL